MLNNKIRFDGDTAIIELKPSYFHATFFGICGSFCLLELFLLQAQVFVWYLLVGLLIISIIYCSCVFFKCLKFEHITIDSNQLNYWSKYGVFSHQQWSEATKEYSSIIVDERSTNSIVLSHRNNPKRNIFIANNKFNLKSREDINRLGKIMLLDVPSNKVSLSDDAECSFIKYQSVELMNLGIVLMIIGILNSIQKNSIDLFPLIVGLLISIPSWAISKVTKIIGNKLICEIHLFGIKLYEKVIALNNLSKAKLFDEQDFFTGAMIPTLLVESSEISFKFKSGWILAELEFLKRQIEKSLPKV